MKVIITKEHAKDAQYLDLFNCPLARALRELFPFALIQVGGTAFHINDETYYFTEQEWDSDLMFDLQDGRIEYVELDIPTLKAPKYENAI
jgi:hypothetical protein